MYCMNSGVSAGRVAAQLEAGISYCHGKLLSIDGLTATDHVPTGIRLNKQASDSYVTGQQNGEPSGNSASNGPSVVKDPSRYQLSTLETVPSDDRLQDPVSLDKPSRVGVTVIVPTYNERENVSRIVSRCLDALSPARYDAEVLVVDDDSEDYTWQYPQRLFGLDKRVRVLRRRAEETGLAISVVDGFSVASNKYCAVIDADLQHPPEKLPDLISALESGADIAIGSRHAAGGGIENWSPTRKTISAGGTLAARAALPNARSVSDPMSGFFAIKRDVVDGVALDPEGYKILLEILAKGRYETTVDVPYVFRDRERGESKLTAGEYKRFLEHLGELAVSSRGIDHVVDPGRAVRAVKFAAVGAAGVVVNMTVFAALAFGVDLYFVLAGILAFLVAVNWNFAGNWLFTYDRPAGGIPEMWARFHLVSLTGLAVYTLTLAIAVGADTPVLLANGIAILTGAGVNFLGTDEAVFPRERPVRGDEHQSAIAVTEGR